MPSRRATSAPGIGIVATGGELTAETRVTVGATVLAESTPWVPERVMAIAMAPKALSVLQKIAVATPVQI